jgi:Domain of unknown function (DUF4124)
MRDDKLNVMNAHRPSAIRHLAHRCLALILPAVMLLSTLPAHATQWKWKDSSGRLQYSDLPPPSSVPDKDILTRPNATVRLAPVPAPGSSGAAGTELKPAAKATDPELEARKRKAEDEKNAEKKAEEAKQAKARAQDCERARGYQKALDDGIRISRTNANGEREILDDAARAKENARNRKAMSEVCK